MSEQGEEAPSVAVVNGVQIGDKVKVLWPLRGEDPHECQAVVESVAKRKRKYGGISCKLLFEDGVQRRAVLTPGEYSVLDKDTGSFVPSAKKQKRNESATGNADGETPIIASAAIAPSDNPMMFLSDRPMKRSLSQQSKTQYMYGWNRYAKFCAERGLSVDAAGGSISEQMEAFLTFVVVEDPVKTVTPAVANSYISAIGKMLIEANQIESMAQIRTPKFNAQLEQYTRAFKLLKQQQVERQEAEMSRLNENGPLPEVPTVKKNIPPPQKQQQRKPDVPGAESVIEV
mmetsp:Transcript_20932/g.30167  ORF Transcript_20932/g.30167 Transcript_20932/m.30167 type:complete len:287 (+) Transcript_20932:115-975(+)